MTSSLSLPESFGKYRVARQIGQGGMGCVWLAHDTLLARPVALKVPHLNNSDDPDPIILARFQREAKAAAALHHPNRAASRSACSRWRRASAGSPAASASRPR